MRLPRIVRKILATLGITLLVAGCAYYYAITPHHSDCPTQGCLLCLASPPLIQAGPSFGRLVLCGVELLSLFVERQRVGPTAQVSQIPPNESVSIPATLWALTQDLARPEAADPETRLRILTIRGMLETNYDASEARSTWQDVAALAIKLHHYELPTRATGEQGIAAFILGDTETAKRQVIRAWGLSKVENDPAATVRYASVFGAGLVQIHRYKEALTPLNQAIKIAQTNPEIAYPTIATYAKIDALTGLHQYEEAIALANASLARLQGTPCDAHKSQVYLSRGTINKERGDWNAAIADYQQSVDFSSKISNYREVTDAGGLLAQAYQHNGNLPDALAAINRAIDANTKIPDELYLVPRNLATKAEIIEKMGHAKEADGQAIACILHRLLERAAHGSLVGAQVAGDIRYRILSERERKGT